MAVLKNVQVRWAQIQAPDTRYDPQWSVDALLTKEQAKAISDAAKKVHKKGVKIKKDDDGQLYYKFSRKVDKADGSGENKAPRCIDGQKNPVTDLIGNGSLCNIQYSVFPWDNKFGTGVGIDFAGIQVLELVSFGGDADEFGVEGEAEGDEFDSSPTTPTAPAEGSEDYDDDDFS